MNKGFSFTDRVTTVTLFSIGLFVSVRGIYWIINIEKSLGESDFYIALHSVMPLYVWGILVLISGVMLMLSSMFYGQRQENNISLRLVVLGGAGGALVNFLMSSAALFNAINWLTPVQFLIMAGLLGFISFVAGVELYARR